MHARCWRARSRRRALDLLNCMSGTRGGAVRGLGEGLGWREGGTEVCVKGRRPILLPPVPPPEAVGSLALRSSQCGGWEEVSHKCEAKPYIKLIAPHF